ncbi:MAG TPA: WYL domain-containing protein, partial [Actinomycetes bacterium]|nr:WYL domain-containing protein [Actinomycetes bacterium]
AMPARALEEARATAEKVWQAVRDNHVLRISYIDVGGVETEREVEPQHVVVGPNGSYLTAYCHLRWDDGVFRMVRVTRAERILSSPRPRRVVAEPLVDGHETKLAESALRPEDLLPNSDIGLSPDPGTVGASRRLGG